MKKRTIVFGSLVACFLMLMTPNISAVEYKSAEALYDDVFIEYLEKKTSHLQTIKQKIIKDSGKFTLSEVKEHITSLTTEGGFLGKVVTIILFFIYLIAAIVYYIIYPIISRSLLNFVKDMEIEAPLQMILALFIIFLSFPGSMFISMIPLFFISDIIEKIGAWDNEILYKIEQSIILIAGIFTLILELIGVLDIYPESNTGTIKI